MPVKGDGVTEELHDEIRRRPQSGWLAAWVIVALLVVGLPLAFGVVALTVALVFGLIWTGYHGLVLPVLSTQQMALNLDSGPRIVAFAVWLGLTACAAFGLVRVWDFWTGNRLTDSVGWALTVSVGAVLLAISLSGWIVFFLFGLGWF